MNLYQSGTHRDIQRDVAVGDDPKLGAESLILADHMEGDADLGSVIYCAGIGGRDQRKKRVADQSMTGLNEVLAANADTHLPVRVVRQLRTEYEYGGLFFVEDACLTKDSSGFLTCRYRLRQAGNEEISPGGIAAAYLRMRAPDRRLQTHFRLVREGQIPMAVKELYDFTCQICGLRLETLAGPYAEAAHLVPLGGGSNGADDMSNILCLCPNHHVLLDHGAIFLSDDFTVVDRAGNVLVTLHLRNEHALDPEYAHLHRKLLGGPE